MAPSQWRDWSRVAAIIDLALSSFSLVNFPFVRLELWRLYVSSPIMIICWGLTVWAVLHLYTSLETGCETNRALQGAQLWRKVAVSIMILGVINFLFNIYFAYDWLPLLV